MAYRRRIMNAFLSPGNRIKLDDLRAWSNSYNEDKGIQIIE